MTSTVLTRTALIRREFFDPSKKEHRASLKSFLKTGNWGRVQFHVEEPFVTVPETVLRKFATFHLKETQNAKKIPVSGS